MSNPSTRPDPNIRAARTRTSTKTAPLYFSVCYIIKFGFFVCVNDRRTITRQYVSFIFVLRNQIVKFFVYERKFKFSRCQPNRAQPKRESFYHKCNPLDFFIALMSRNAMLTGLA